MNVPFIRLKAAAINPLYAAFLNHSPASGASLNSVNTLVTKNNATDITNNPQKLVKPNSAPAHTSAAIAKSNSISGKLCILSTSTVSPP